MRTRPSLTSMAGMMVCSGLFPGPTALACPSAQEARSPRSLPRDVCVGVSERQGEADASVVQDNTAPRSDETGSEVVEQRVDEDRRIAVLVHDADIDRAAAGVLRRMRSQIRYVAMGYLRTKLAGKSLGENLRDADAAGLRGGERRIAHGIGQATGFDLQMIALDRQRVRMDWRGGENVEDEQRDDALTIGRAL